jgi:hypothetical protein
MEKPHYDAEWRVYYPFDLDRPVQD